MYCVQNSYDIKSEHSTATRCLKFPATTYNTHYRAYIMQSHSNVSSHINCYFSHRNHSHEPYRRYGEYLPRAKLYFPWLQSCVEPLVVS